jgi:hypothetical protein
MSAKRKDPKELSNSQRMRRIEFLNKRIRSDKAEAATLTEHLIADLKTNN